MFRFKSKIKNAQSIEINAWNRFTSEKTALVSSIYIAIIAIVSLFTYFIVPDKTQNTDRQHLELALLPSGTEVMFFKSSKEQQATYSLWEQFINGKPELYNWTPIKSYQLNNNILTIEKITYYNQPNTIQEQIDVKNIPFFSIEKNIVKKTFWLGADRFGRDFLSRMILGARISLLIGFTAVIISLIVGIIIGSLAGYYGGKIDAILSWFMNVVWSIPTLLMVLAITIALGKGLIPVFIAVGLSMWVDVARIVRGQFLSLREKEFVEAGKALGFTDSRIIFKHILPNALAPILVIATSNFASAILIEAGLSFLGFGVQPPAPTWGNMIEANRAYIITEHAHLALIPGFAIASLVLAFTLLSNGIKNAVLDKQ